MNLKFKNINEEKNIERIEKIYEESFPENERIAFKNLRKSAKRRNNQFFAIYDDQYLIGMTYLTFDKNATFILYLAIDETYQNKGYGSAVLKELQEKYKDYYFLLDIEQVQKNCWNYKQRIMRKKFYEKNGFSSTNLGMTYRGEDYEILCTDNLPIDDKMIIRLFSKLYHPIIRIFARFYKLNLYEIEKL